MKKYLSLFLLTLLIAACEKEHGEQIGYSLPFENDKFKVELVNTSCPDKIRAIHFFNSSEGLVSTHYGEIYLTRDGGQSWDLKHEISWPDDSNSPVLDVFYFINSTTGFALGGSSSCRGTILKTDNAGENWTSVFLDSSNRFSSMTKNATGDLFATSDCRNGSIYISRDNGEEWTLTDSTDIRYREIAFSHNTGYAIPYGDDTSMISQDGGVTWNKDPFLPAQFPTKIAFKEKVGLLLDQAHRVYKTHDNGQLWYYIYTTRASTYWVKIISDEKYLAFGSGSYIGDHYGYSIGAIRYTDDGGKTWQDVEFSGLLSIRYASLFSEKEGYAVADRKLIKVTLK